ncbi:MAG: rfaF [Verrucomicrobiales bacterium]|nr:rfaF [Verrucomicrobiales bacterium]
MSHRFTYLVYRLVETTCRILPLTLIWHAGRILGRVGCLLFPGYKRLVRRNLEIAFGSERSRAELAWLTRDHFAMLTANLLCSLKISWMSEKAVARRLEVVGGEKITAALEAGHGVIYALCHMGNWEVLSQTKLMGPGTKSAAMFQALSNPFLNAHVKRQRARVGHRLFDRNDGFHGPSQWLRENGVLGILVDQHAGDGGVWCPLFGRLASTTNLPALLSRRTGAPILTLSVETTKAAFWKITVGDPLPRAGGRMDTDTVTAVMNAAVETGIRRSPADWFWVHNRWKTPNPDFLLIRYKRGAALPPGQAMENLQRFEILIRSTNWLGDACMSVPAVRAIKRGRPDARVTILTPEKLAGFWRAVDGVDEVLSIPKGEGIRGAARVIKGSGRTYDTAILFPNSLRAALEARLARIARVVGYKGHSRKWLLHQIIPPKKRITPTEHHVRHYLRIAWRLGADVEDPTLRDPLPGAQGKQSRTVIGSGRETMVFRWGEDRQEEELRIGICAGAEYGPAKRWPLDRFAEAIKQIKAARPEAKFVLFGAPGETAMGEELNRLTDGQCENKVGRTTLEELMEELRRCRLLLTNDTGTMHLAALLGTRVAAIFGSTEPDWTGPLGNGHVIIRRHVECSPCFLRQCPLDFRCMKEITSERVGKEVLHALDH